MQNEIEVDPTVENDVFAVRLPTLAYMNCVFRRPPDWYLKTLDERCEFFLANMKIAPTVEWNVGLVKLESIYPALKKALEQEEKANRPKPRIIKP